MNSLKNLNLKHNLKKTLNTTKEGANKTRRFLKKHLMPLDLLADKPVERLHFDGKEEHKSYVGAMCTICMVILFITITAV